jgi:adenosylmethionine-8-amino-7-oxononanoate aminotransferase
MAVTPEAAARLFPQDSGLPVAVRGKGIRIWDEDGNEYLDACSGAVSVISIGHGVDEVADAMAEQARTLAYVHSLQFGHAGSRELAARIGELAPGSLNRAVFYSGGSEAVEGAVKLARHYHLMRGRDSKHLVISRRRSYHGATLFTLGVGGVTSRRQPYLPYLAATPKQVECNPYRCPFGSDHPCCNLACADDLERVVAEVGAEAVSCYIAEPIVAAAAPALIPPPGYFERIRGICDAHDILFIADEIVTGWGRTGRMFGIEHWDAEPDMIVSAKGLSGGYMPLSTVIFSDAIAAVFEQAGTPFVHNYTYEAHPVAAAAALAVLRILERDGLVENAARQGDYLLARLRGLAEQQPLVGDVRGKGLLTAFELVADRQTRAPLPPELGVTARLHRLVRERGVLIYPGAGADGVVGDQFLVSPPLVVTRADIDEIVGRIALALSDLTRELPV